MMGKMFGLFLLVVFLVGCAPLAAEPTAAPQVSLTATPLQGGVGELETAPAPAATSRGDKLIASDPASIKFGDGKPALVEFFRFT